MTALTRNEESLQSSPRPAELAEPEKGGQNGGLKSQLRGADFEEGEALLAPAGADKAAPAPAPTTEGQTTAGPTTATSGGPVAAGPATTTTQPAKTQEAPAAAPKKITNEERQQILKAKAADINKLEDLLSYGVFDLNVTEKEANKAIGLIEKAAQPSRIVMIQELNRRKGAFVDRLMSNLTGGAKKAHPSSYLTLVVLSGQTGELEKLLKDKPSAAGVGPAAGDALAFAMSSLPPDLLTTIGKDAGAADKATAWAAVTPAPVGPQMSKRIQAAKVEGAETRAAQEERKEQVAVLDKSTKEAMAKDKDFAATVENIEDLLSYGAFDWAITDKEATKVFRILSGLGDTQRVQMAVYQLDRGAFMDRFVDNIPGGVRSGDKKTFLRIISARQPDKNVKYVQEIMSYGVFDWKITDEEGRLAFAIIKTMPKDVRDSFQKKDGGKWWDRMEGNLSTEDAGDRDTNLYSNEGESQKLKLSFKEECGSLGSTLLRQKIEMLLRMGEVDFVEQSLLAAGLDQDVGHAWIYAKYGFAGGGRGRNSKIFGAWMDNKIPSPEDGSWWSGLASAFKALGMAASAGAHELFGTKGNAAAELDLMGLAELAGGSLAGMTFAERKDDSDNRIAVDMQLASGRVQVSSPKLAIAAINRFSGGVQLETGPVTVTGLHFDVKWPTKDDPSTYFHVKVDGIEADGIWQVTEDQMTTVDKLTIGGFEMRGERAVGELPPDTVSALSTLMGEMSDTFTGLMGAVRVDSADAQAISSHLGASMLGGMPATVSLGSLGVQGYATSDGGSVAEASVRDLKAEMKHDQLGDKLRTELATLEGMAARDAAQDARVATLKSEIARITPLENRAAELMAKQSDPKSPLEPAEREELKGLRDQLTVMSTELSVGVVAAKDVAVGNQSIGSLEATDLKASGSAQRPGADGKAGLESGYQAEASFSAGSVKISDLESKGSNRLDAYKARLAELKARITGGLADDAETAQYESLFTEVRAVEKQVVERDALLLKDAPSAKESARLTELTSVLTPWVTLKGASSVGQMEMQGLEGSVDAQTGTMKVKAESIAATDIAAEGMKVDDIKVTGAEAQVGLKGTAGSAMAAGDAKNASLIDQVSHGKVKAESVEMTGLDMQGKKPSIALREKLESMQQQEKLRPGSLSAPELKVLAGLPAELQRAETHEARMDELRALRKSDPENFNAGLVAELKMLEQKCEATWLKVASFQANHVEAGLDAEKGAITLDAGGHGKAGVTATGIASGHVVDGEQVIENRIDAVKADKLGADIKGKDGRLPDGLAMSQGSQGFELGLHGKGVEVLGMQKGEKDAAGSSSIEAARIGSLDLTMDSEKDGGRMDVKVLDAELVGLKQKSTSILDAAYADVAKFQGILDGGGTLTAKQQDHLNRANGILKDAASLQTDIDAAKTEAEKAKLTKRMKTWIATNDVAVGHATLTDLELGVSGIGNPLNAGSNSGGANMNIDARIKGEATVSDVMAGDASLKSGTVRDVSAKINDMNSETDRTIDASLGSFDVKGAKGTGGSVGAASGKNITVDGQGKNMQVGADHIGASNVHAGGSSVKRVDVSGVHAAVTDMGGDKQTVTGSVAGVSASGVKNKSRGADGSTTVATVGKLKGRRGSFAMKPGGKVSGNLKSFSGSDIGVVSKDKSGATTLDAHVGTVTGSGAEFANGPGGVKTKLANAEATNITASGSQLGGQTIEVGAVRVNGAEANVGKDGSFDAKVAHAGAENIRRDDGKGHMSTVESVDIKGVHAKGSTRDKVITDAGVGSMEVRGVSLQDDGVSATLDLAVVNDVSLKNVDYSDPAAIKGGASVGSAEVRGLEGSYTDKKTGATTSGKLDAAGFNDLSAYSNGENAAVGLGNAYVRGAEGTTDVIDAKTGQKTGQRKVGVESVDVNGVKAEAHLGTGDYVAGVDKVAVKGAKSSQTDLSGNEVMHANADAVGLDYIKAGGNYKDGEHVASVHKTTASGLDYKGVGADGVAKEAKVESVEVNGLKGSAGKDGSMGVGFRDVTVKGVDYNQGESGKPGYVTAQVDKFKAGNGRDMSSIVMKPDGTIDGSIKAIELGEGTKAAWVSKDPKTGAPVTNYAGLKSSEKGGLNVGEIRMKDFNPADLSSDNSQLQVFDVDAHSFIYQSGTNQVIGKGAHLDAAFVKGGGDGRVMAGYSGMGLDEVHANMDLPDGGHAKVDAKGIRSDGGYAMVDGFKEGQDFSLAYAHLKSLEGDSIKADIKVPPPKTGMEAYQAAYAKYQKDLELWKAGKGPKPSRVNLDGLKHMNGRVEGSYVYNEDDDNVWDSIGAAFTGRSVEGGVDIKNGSVDMSTLDAGTGEFSLLGSAADIALIQPFLLGVRTGASIDGMINQSGGLLSVEDLANLPADKYAMQMQLYRDHPEAYKRIFKGPPGRPDAPEWDDYKSSTIAEKRHDLTRIDVNAHLQDIGGGTIGAGGVEGQMNKGGSADVKGNVGEHLNAEVRKIGFTDVTAAGGDVKVGSAGVDKVVVDVYNAKDPNNTRATVDVQGAKVTAVDVKGAGVDKKQAEADFDAMTNKTAK